jgi:hypothetical protein
VLLREVKDIRVARKHLTDTSPGHAPDRGETALTRREADKLPIRFI